jgi:hypothetical protein
MKARLILVFAAIATLTAGILFLAGGEVNSSPKSATGKRTESFNLDTIVISLLQVVTLTSFCNLVTKPCSRELMKALIPSLQQRS